MKKRFVCLTLALLALFSFVSCAKEGPEIPTGFLLAENEGADYYFFYPESWLLDRSDAGMTSVYVSEIDFSNVSVTAFTATDDYTSLPDYAENHYLKQFDGNFTDLVVERNQDETLKRSVLKVDEKDAIAFNYSARFGEDTYRFRSWLVSYNGYIYTILYTAKEDRFEENLLLAEKIVEYIQFR